MGFEVALEGQGLLSIAEGEVGIESPWSVFCRVRALTRIVVIWAFLNVFRETGIVPVWMGLAFEDVHVVEGVGQGDVSSGSVPGRSSQRCR